MTQLVSLSTIQTYDLAEIHAFTAMIFSLGVELLLKNPRMGRLSSLQSRKVNFPWD
jgi:hypothetical protein